MNSDTSSERVHDQRPSAAAPRWVLVGLFLMTATSSYVIVEPAPCDLLFAIVAPLLLLTGWYSLVWPMNPLMYFGAGLLFVINVVSMAMAREPSVSARYWMITVYLLLYWLLVISLVAKIGPRAYRTIVWGFQTAAMFTATIGNLAGMQLIPNWQQFMLEEGSERIRSTFKDANVLGPFLVAASAMLIADAIVRRRIKLWHAVFLANYALAILLTFSRGAYLAAIVTIGSMVGIFWMLGKYRHAVNWLMLRLAPLSLVLAVAAVFALEQINLTDFFVNRFAYQSYDDERFENQQHILRTVGQSPVGIGPGSWNLHHYLHDVHSLFLRSWVEHGHLGLIAVLCMLIGWFVATWHCVVRAGPNQAIYIVCFAVVLGIMSNSFSIDTIHWRHLFLFLGIPVGLLAYEVHRDATQAGDPFLSALAARTPRWITTASRSH
jgi:hypothetical protein